MRRSVLKLAAGHKAWTAVTDGRTSRFPLRTLCVQMKQLWKDELVSAKTRCWAQGMDGWRALQLIPQLKWSLLATGQALMNETELATLILNMLIRMCEYYPSR